MVVYTCVCMFWGEVCGGEKPGKLNQIFNFILSITARCLHFYHILSLFLSLEFTSPYVWVLTLEIRWERHYATHIVSISYLLPFSLNPCKLLKDMIVQKQQYEHPGTPACETIWYKILNKY